MTLPFPDAALATSRFARRAPRPPGVEQLDAGGRSRSRSERSSSSSCLSSCPKSTRAASWNERGVDRRAVGLSISLGLARSRPGRRNDLDRARATSSSLGSSPASSSSRLHLGGPERPALGQPSRPGNGSRPLDEDVHPPVVERVRSPRSRAVRVPISPEPVVVLEDQAELAARRPRRSPISSLYRSSKMWSGTRSLGSRTSSSGKRPISGTRRRLSRLQSLRVASRPSPRSPTASSGRAVQEPRPVRAGQAGRGGAARARARAMRQARVERGPVRRRSRLRSRRSRAASPSCNRYPGRRRLAAARGARRARYGVALRGGRGRRRRRRADRLPLAGDARPGRRDRLRLALVPELRDRRGQAGRDAGAGARCGTTATTSTRCSRRSRRGRTLVYVCHPNNPTGTMNTRARARRVPRSRPGPRAGRDRPGVPRVRRRPRLPGRDRGVLSRPAARSRCCGRSRRSTASPGCASATWSPPGRGHGREQGQARVRRLDRVRRRRALASLDELPRRSRGAGALNAEATRRARRDPRRGRTSPPAGPAVANFLYADTGADSQARCSEALLPKGRDRPPAARLRRADGDSRHLRHAGRERVLRRRARPRASRRPGALTSQPCVPPFLAPPAGRAARSSPSFRLLFGSLRWSRASARWIAVIALTRRRLRTAPARRSGSARC